MRVVYGLYEAWLTPEFFLERGKAYDADDPTVAAAMRRQPAAFGESNPVVDAERRGPGRPRSNG